MSGENYIQKRFYDRTAFLSDRLQRIASVLDGVDPTVERRKIIDHLELKAGDRVLEVAVGTGINIPIMKGMVRSKGSVVGVDLSIAMLAQSKRKLESSLIQAGLIAGDAIHLPFRDRAFDAVLHFGGLNRFEDKRGAIEEVVRVAKSGARIVISDKFLPLSRKKTWREKALLKLEPQLAENPPLALIPKEMGWVELDWCWGGMVYILKLTNP